jgi:hypothetical protein
MSLFERSVNVYPCDFQEKFQVLRAVLPARIAPKAVYVRRIAERHGALGPVSPGAEMADPQPW